MTVRIMSVGELKMFNHPFKLEDLAQMCPHTGEVKWLRFKYNTLYKEVL